MLHRWPCRFVFVRPAWLLPVLMIAGCARYHAKPLNAARSAQALTARRLSDTRLIRFLGKMGVHPSGQWNLHALVLVAVYERPDLKIAHAHYAITRGGVETAAAVPNPELALEPTFNAAPVQAIPSPWTIGPVVSFLVSSLGARQAGLEAARDKAAAARTLIATTAWQERGAVRDAMLELWLARQQRRLAEQEADLAGRARAILARRAEAGMVAEAVVAQATETAQKARFAAAEARRRIAIDRVKLAGAVGLPAAALDHARLSFGAFAHPATPGNLARLTRQALTHRPSVVAALSRYRAAEAKLRQAIDEQYPGFRIGPGYHYDEGANKFLIAFTIPLPVFNQNQGPIAKARAHRALAAARFRDIQQKALAAIDTAAADWQASRRAETEARRAAATARSRAHRARLAFQAGATGRLALFEAERSAVVGRQQTLLAEAQRLRALGNLADALHHPFFGGGTR